LEKILLNAKIDAKRVHGSRDYFQFKENNILFELVPVLDIKKFSQAKNITDSTPFHVDWFLKKAKKNKNLRNEVRLVKQFCKSQKVYGAESYIQGFSGHVIDILTVLFGSFKKFVNFFSNLEKYEVLKKYDSRKIIFDVENFYSKKYIINNTNILKKLNDSKIDSPIIVIDPITKTRNAASALSVEKLNILIDSCKKYVLNPSKEFFKIKNFKSGEIKKRIKQLKKDKINSYAALLKLKPIDTKKDVSGAKIMRLAKYLRNRILEKEFLVYDYDFDYNKKESYIWFLFDIEELNKDNIIKGPKTSSKIHIKRFREKHKKTFVKDNIVYAKIKRDFTNPYKYLKYLMKNDSYFKDKCQSVKIKKITSFLN